MAGTEYFGPTTQPRDHIPEFCLSTPCGNHKITHFRGTDTTIHNHAYIIISRLTQAKYHQITRKNSAYWQITPLDFYLTLVLFKFPDVRSHGRQTSIDPVCSPNSLDPDKSSLTILLSLNSCYSWKLIPGTKALVFTLEKRTISYLSVSARIGVIDLYQEPSCLYVFLGFFSHNNLTTFTFMGQIYNKELNYFCRLMPTGPVYTLRKWILFQGPRVLKSFHWNSRIVRASMRHGEWMCIDQCWSTNKRQSDMWVK